MALQRRPINSCTKQLTVISVGRGWNATGNGLPSSTIKAPLQSRLPRRSRSTSRKGSALHSYGMVPVTRITAHTSMNNLSPEVDRKVEARVPAHLLGGPTVPPLPGRPEFADSSSRVDARRVRSVTSLTKVSPEPQPPQGKGRISQEIPIATRERRARKAKAEKVPDLAPEAPRPVQRGLGIVRAQVRRETDVLKSQLRFAS